MRLFNLILGWVGGLVLFALIAATYGGGGSGPYFNGPAVPPGNGQSWLGLNAGSTNLGVSIASCSNIVISPDTPLGSPNAASVFTNASGAIFIGQNNGNNNNGAVKGNGIKIGAPGGVGTNSIAIGQGNGAAGLLISGVYTQPGAIAIGNNVECSGSGSLAIGNSDQTYISQGGQYDYFIGEQTDDGGGSAVPVTNSYYIGHWGKGLQLSNNTVYFGNGPGGTTNSGRTRNFVFVNGGAYNDDGSMIGNSFGLTNQNPAWRTNLFSSGGAVDPNTNRVFFISSASAVTLPGFVNLDLTKDYEPVFIVSNSGPAAFTPLLPSGTVIFTNAVNTAALSIPAGRQGKFRYLLYPHLGQFFTNCEVWVQSN